MKQYKSGDVMVINGGTAEIGINNVVIFDKWSNMKIEFWKDETGVYHAGFAYYKLGEEFRYKHVVMGEEPKKWENELKELKEMYENIVPQVSFTNYK